MVMLLLGDRFAPITSSIALLNTDIELVVERFVEWMQAIELKYGRKVEVRSRSFSGLLPDALTQLLPLTSVEIRRHLFVSTSANWTAYFNNAWRGTDTGSYMHYMPQVLQCKGVQLTAIPDTIQDYGNTFNARWGATILGFHSHQSTGLLNLDRLIQLIHEPSGWNFRQLGIPYKFENLQAYERRIIQSRFTLEMLRSYLLELGLTPFQEEFYTISDDQPALLVEKIGETNPSLVEYSLAKARSDF